MDLVGRAVVSVTAASGCAILLLHVSLEPHVSLVAAVFMVVEVMLTVVLHGRD